VPQGSPTCTLLAVAVRHQKTGGEVSQVTSATMHTLLGASAEGKCLVISWLCWRQDHCWLSTSRVLRRFIRINNRCSLGGYVTSYWWLGPSLSASGFAFFARTNPMKRNGFIPADLALSVLAELSDLSGWVSRGFTDGLPAAVCPASCFRKQNTNICVVADYELFLVDNRLRMTTACGNR